MENSSAVLLYSSPDFIKLLFHIRNHFKLSPASVEVVTCPVNLEILIPLQMIAQEAHPALEGHQDHRKS